MSKSESFLAFEAALKDSKELQEKFIAAQKRIIENKEAASDGEVIVKAAAEIGFTLTIEELERALAQAEELNEEELGNVSGGAATAEALCLYDYYCYTAYNHDNDGKKDRPCWSDYYCVIISNYEEGYESYI